MKFRRLRNPRGVCFTHWIFALMDSLAAFVTRCRRYVMMFSKRRFSVCVTLIMGCNRFRTAQLCHHRK